MSYSTPTTPEVVSARRMLIQGAANMGKTASVYLTWPKPIHFQVYPGEKGFDTIPRGKPDITPHLWTADPVSSLASSVVVNEVEKLTWEILDGKRGPITTFCGDGLHKYYYYVLDMISGGQLARGESPGEGGDVWAGPRIYDRARNHFRFCLNRIMASPVPYIVFTCWDGKEAEKPGVKGSAMFTYPDFPGKSAKEIMGEFSVTVYATLDWGNRQPGKPPKTDWQLLPEGDIRGANIKAPPEMMMHLPAHIPQSLPLLEETLEKAWTLSTTPPKT